jgi:hypothetical protein
MGISYAPENFIRHLRTSTEYLTGLGSSYAVRYKQDDKILHRHVITSGKEKHHWNITINRGFEYEFLTTVIHYPLFM